MNAAQVLQSNWHHKEQRSAAQELHETFLEHQSCMHRAAIQQASHLHEEKHRLVVALFASLRSHETAIASREAMRDLWQQRNERAQTMMVVGALVFGCAYTTLVDGTNQLPTVRPPNQEAMTAYSGLVGLSLLTILSSLMLQLVFYQRMAMFDVHRPLKVYSFCSDYCSGPHPNFLNFFFSHCRQIEQAAVGFFAFGVALVLSSCIVLQSIKYYYWYDDGVCAWMFGVLAVLGPLWQLIGPVFFSDETHREPEGSNIHS